ncbi:melanoma-associated antigen B1-like [Rhinolophus sinicus]|uniref:melanoma-associated antigen B1-like n=1 Tax=Rhinolophus sinicus TaxID=89399 RepID=UPI003D78C854
MPRGPKSRRLQGAEETESLRGDQSAAAATEEECPTSPVSGGSPQSCPAPGPFQEPQGASATGPPEAGVSYPRSDEGAQSQAEEGPSTSFAASATRSAREDPLTREAHVLVRFLLGKYKLGECITWAEMLKAVKKKYREHFSEVLRRASERMELLFGLEVKEVDPGNHFYSLITLLDLPSEGSLNRDKSIPKTGLLVNILAVIFLKGNRATEEEVWKSLNVLGVYAGKRHAVFGEPKKLIMKDLVQPEYLEYRQVPGSDPPCYEFLWGPRAHAETTKMRVLEIMARLNKTAPSSFPKLYEEALRDEEERAEVRAAARAASVAKASAPSKAPAHSSSHM